MASEGISGMKLAKKLGIPASTFKKIRSKEITNPTIATLLPIARYFSVPLEYFLEAENSLDNTTDASKQKHHIPLLSWVEAKEFSVISPNHVFYVSTERNYGMHVFALRIEEGYELLFPSGSYIVVDSDVTPQHGDLVISKGDHLNLIIKQFVNRDGKNYLVSLDNKEMTLFTPGCLLGVVIEYQRKLILYNSK